MKHNHRSHESGRIREFIGDAIGLVCILTLVLGLMYAPAWFPAVRAIVQ